jgi:hypothetical protein
MHRRTLSTKPVPGHKHRRSAAAHACDVYPSLLNLAFPPLLPLEPATAAEHAAAPRAAAVRAADGQSAGARAGGTAATVGCAGCAGDS